MSWFSQTIHVIDFEGNTDSGVVEYGVVSICEGQIIATETQLCKAKALIHAKDSLVHGIQTEDTLDFPEFETHWTAFNRLRKQGPLAAHHAPYENMLLTHVWPYCSAAPDFLKKEENACSWGPWVDSCELYRVLFPGLKSYRLSKLVAVFELQGVLEDYVKQYCPEGRRRYHCALYDALASALLLNKLSETKAIREQSLEWLLLSSMVCQAKREDHQQLTLF